MPPSRRPFPSVLQFLLAPRTMRRIALWMSDHELSFEEARMWHVAWSRFVGHLRETYGPRWRRKAPARLRVLARPDVFEPGLLPEGTPGREIVR